MTRWYTHVMLLLICGLTAGAPPGPAAPVAAGKFYLVGLGPAGPEHATLKALETIRQADLILCHPELAEPFRTYLQGKKILDPWKDLWLKPQERRLPVEKRRGLWAAKKNQRDEFVKQMQGLLSQGKNIALLTGGDPTIYSRAFWLLEGFPDSQVEVIPGLGAMGAALAALKRAGTGAGARFLLQTAPSSFFGREDHDELARKLAKYSATLVFYMGLKDIGALTNTLKKYHPADLPAAVVYYAGDARKEKVVQGTLDTIAAQVASEPEKWRGLIIVGQCLQGPAFDIPE